MKLLGQDIWKRYKLDEGWAGLILCMMWESAQGSTSQWADYLGERRRPLVETFGWLSLLYHTSATLPTTFDTPMFWSDADLDKLKGTTVLGMSFAI